MTPLSKTLVIVNLLPTGSTTLNGLNPSSTMTFLFISKNLFSVAVPVLDPLKSKTLGFSATAAIGFNPGLLLASTPGVIGSSVTDLEISMPVAALASVGTSSKPPVDLMPMPIPGAFGSMIGILVRSIAPVNGAPDLPVVVVFFVADVTVLAVSAVAVFVPVTVAFIFSVTSVAVLPSLESSKTFPSVVSSTILVGSSTA